MITGSLITTNIIMVNNPSHDLFVSNYVYLAFTSGGAISGVYQVIWRTNNTYFAVATADAQNLSGTGVIPKLTGGGFTIANKVNLTYSTSLPHGLGAGTNVYINFSSSPPADGLYQIVSVPDATHFTITVPTSNNGSQNNASVFPLAPPPITRSGNVTISWNTWLLNATDTGSSSSLSQTPLNSPTVFNFFFPDYKFPGPLAAAGLTTPEFQLTSDTTAVFQMNFLENGVFSNGNNTNGLSSFSNGTAGALYIDVGAYMATGYTSNGGLASLVDALNTLLCAGQLTPLAKTQIVNYASTLAYTTPTFAQMRDRVRAVVHLILNSPDYTIQR
jgi:hypothetical protein